MQDRGAAGLQYHGYLDRFAMLGQCVIAEGWANHLDLALWYDGVPLDLSIVGVPRPDLVAPFGAEAKDWGFSMCAALKLRDIDRRKFLLRFNAGITRSDPASGFRAHDDTKFDDMTKGFRDAVAANKGRLLEIGSRARSGTTYRHWFPSDMDYVGLDITSGPNVDIVGDAHHLSRYVGQNINFIFSIAVFEHLLMPWKVALEMNKVLVDGGLALIISHPAWPLHEEPWDFFRFSTDAWRGIFNRHTGFDVVNAQYQYPANIVPQYANSDIVGQMHQGRNYLLSGCLVRKVGDAKVAWEADPGEIYNLDYSHA